MLLRRRSGPGSNGRLHHNVSRSVLRCGLVPPAADPEAVMPVPGRVIRVQGQVILVLVMGVRQ